MSDFYTVTEYANMQGKDPGNIRRMLIHGKLIGEKVGNQWLIPKDTTWPEDGRVNTGDYKNWRIKWNVYHNAPKLMKALNRMSKQIAAVYGDKLEKIVLYGSYARGEQNQESDVDIAVFLQDTSDETLHDQMTDLVVDYELDLGVTLSVVSLEMNSYNEWKESLPFYQNIDKEGIILWKTA